MKPPNFLDSVGVGNNTPPEGNKLNLSQNYSDNAKSKSPQIARKVRTKSPSISRKQVSPDKSPFSNLDGSMSPRKTKRKTLATSKTQDFTSLDMEFESRDDKSRKTFSHVFLNTLIGHILLPV